MATKRNSIYTTERAITARFITAMNAIKANARAGNTHYTTLKDISQSVGINYRIIAQYKNPAYDRRVNLHNCAMLCKIHRVSLYWLFFKQGPMFEENQPSKPVKPFPKPLLK